MWLDRAAPGVERYELLAQVSRRPSAMPGIHLRAGVAGHVHRDHSLPEHRSNADGRVTPEPTDRARSWKTG